MMFMCECVHTFVCVHASECVSVKINVYLVVVFFINCHVLFITLLSLLEEI